MKKLFTTVISTLTLATIGVLAYVPFTFAAPNSQLIAEHTGLSPQIVNLAIKGYDWAKANGDVKNSNYLTIVDFNLPSTDKRLWVVNLNDDQVVYNTLVGQGQASGLLYATYFSNQPGSHASSLGVYTTGSTFYGNDGFSMHVHGLENGVNNNAYNRLIEMHGAWYISHSFIDAHGYLGRTWGCFGLNKKDVSQVINTIKGGSVLFAYATPENHDPNIA